MALFEMRSFCKVIKMECTLFGMCLKRNMINIVIFALSFYRSQIFLCRSKYFEPAQKFIYILYQTKKGFAFKKIGFCAGTNVFEEALNAVKFLGWLKKFEPAQSILGHVKVQGIYLSY
jgi:hypothetical protein